MQGLLDCWESSDLNLQAVTHQEIVDIDLGMVDRKSASMTLIGTAVGMETIHIQ